MQEALGCRSTMSRCHGSNTMGRVCFLPGPCWRNKQGQSFQPITMTVAPGLARVCGPPPGLTALIDAITSAARVVYVASLKTDKGEHTCRRASMRYPSPRYHPRRCA